jgi:hypothetical protein
MKSRLLIAALLLSTLWSIAHAARGVDFRVGLEAPFYTYVALNGGGSSSFTMADTVQPAINAVVSFELLPFLTVGIEGREGISSSGSASRTGTYAGPAVTLGFSRGFFNRFALPVHLEPGPTFATFRAATGYAVRIARISVYLEGIFDYAFSGDMYSPISGNTTSPSHSIAIGAGSGLWLRF